MANKFDPEKDETIKEEELPFLERKTKIIVSIKRYNQGEAKIQVSRMNGADDDWKFAKLGRMVREEAIAVAKALANLGTELEG